MNSHARSVRAEDLNPSTCQGASQRASARLREPQTGSKPPAREAPLSVAALPSVIQMALHVTIWNAQSQCGHPTTITIPGGTGDASLTRASSAQGLARTAQKKGCRAAWASALTYISLICDSDAGTSCHRELPEGSELNTYFIPTALYVLKQYKFGNIAHPHYRVCVYIYIYI